MTRTDFLAILETWLSVTKNYNLPAWQLSDALLRSELFQRLVRGEDPLPYPPPTLYGRPAYHVCDGNAHPIREITISGNDISVAGQMFTLISRLGDYRWLLRYEPSAPLFILDMGCRLPTIQMHDARNWFRL